MIAITPEPAIGMSRNTDRHGPESPVGTNSLELGPFWDQNPLFYGPFQ